MPRGESDSFPRSHSLPFRPSVAAPARSTRLTDRHRCQHPDDLIGRRTRSIASSNRLSVCSPSGRLSPLPGLARLGSARPGLKGRLACYSYRLTRLGKQPPH
ncbi:unnamed protein product [Protopolystoma xenopodis]|uniref:Uncharacterized protein n=1 Tax=Protopolystoma xenopodis TaxID=117903 RepID=A0A3S5FH55_9PLAT|nr:unnamed protein product [Protopolystoma xenopodis]